jgi:hypothetical protein
VTDAFEQLKSGVIQIGNQVVNAPSSAGRAIGEVGNVMDLNRLEEVDWGTGVFIGSAIYHGVLCVASKGTSPGQGYAPGTQSFCSANACACAAGSIYAAIKRRSDMSPEEQQQLNSIVNYPVFIEATANPSFQGEVERFVRENGLEKRSCQLLSDSYLIWHNITWGTASESTKTSWLQQGCQNSPSVTPTCQYISNTFGVCHDKSWGNAPQYMREIWLAQGCRTCPG